MARVVLNLRGKSVAVGGSSKADMARELLGKGYTVSEISKAVPMAYSQVHTISKSFMPTEAEVKERTASIRFHTNRQKAPAPYNKPGAKDVTPKEKPVSSYPAASRPTSKKRQDEAKEWAGKRVSKIIDESTSGRIAEQRSIVSPLRGGKPLGKCANCGFELLAQMLGGQRQMIHTGMSGEEYLEKVQFCHAYPASLPKVS